MIARPTLPASLESERALLGAILTRPAVLAEAQASVAVEDFYHPAHRLIFAAMVALDRRGKPVDPVTIAVELDAQEALGRVEGDQAYLIALMDEGFATANAGAYARTVAQKARQRDLVGLCTETAAKARGDVDVDELLADVEKAVFALARSYAQEQTVSMREIVRDAIERLNQRRSGKVTGIPTGFAELDALLCGLGCDELIVLAARPRVGKSALAVGMLMNAARVGFSGLMFSLEMAKAQLGDRALSQAARVGLSRLRSASLGAHDWKNLAKGAARLHELPIEFDFSGGLTIQAIRARARRWAARQKQPGVVVVDYAQMVRVGGKRLESREREVAEISSGLKALAKEIHMPVVTLAALNRKCEERQDKRPTLSDIRESGSLESDADVVLGLYRDEVYDADSEKKGIAEVIVLKQRQGCEGTTELRWYGDFTLFESLDGRRDDTPAYGTPTNGHSFTREPEEAR